MLLRHRPPEDPVGADDLAAAAMLVIDDQQVIADGIETVEVPPLGRHLGGRLRAHLLIEDAVAERLRLLDLARGFRHAQLEIADAYAHRTVLELMGDRHHLVSARCFLPPLMGTA